jgi:hypothetical protein
MHLDRWQVKLGSVPTSGTLRVRNESGTVLGLRAIGVDPIALFEAALDARQT